MHTYVRIVKIYIYIYILHAYVDILKYLSIYIYIHVCLILRRKIGNKIEVIEIHKKSYGIYCQYGLARNKIEVTQIHKKSCDIYYQYVLAQKLHRRNKTRYNRSVCMLVTVQKFAKDYYLRVSMKQATGADVAAADNVAIGS